MRIISGSLSGACWRLLTQNNPFSYQKWCPGTSLDPAGASWLRMNDFPTRRPAEGSLAPGGCQRHRKTWKMQTLSVSQSVVRTGSIQMQPPIGILTRLLGACCFIFQPLTPSPRSQRLACAHTRTAFQSVLHSLKPMQTSACTALRINEAHNGGFSVR